MARDAHIPIFLWVATAALVHIVGGFEAEKVASVLESQSNLRKFARSVAQHVRRENSTQEVAFLDEAELERLLADRSSDEVAPPAEEDPAETDEEPEPKEGPSEANDHAERRPDETRPDPKSPEPERPDEPEPPKPEQKQTVQAEIMPLDRERRISVQQAAEENQPDNPDAEFIADQANHVERQTQARITSSDENSPDPNPGTNTAPPLDQPGNARLTETGQSDDAPGNPEMAPAESSRDGKDQEERSQQVASGGQLLGGDPARESAGDDPGKLRQAVPESRGQQAEVARAAAPEQSEIVTSDQGHDHVHGPSVEQQAREARAAVREQRRQGRSRKSPDLGGFGSMNTTPGGIDPNLNPLTAMAAIGSDQLSRERRADGQRRRSMHRGS